MLPPGWSRHLDWDDVHSGAAAQPTPYYSNAAAGQTTWLLYWQLADPSGRPYFVNVEDGEATWTRPGDDELTAGAVVVLPA